MTQVPEPRIGDAEREAAVSALGDHFAAGRLTKEEFDERSAQAWIARTNSELWPLFVDLPSPQASRPRATVPERTGATAGAWHHEPRRGGPWRGLSLLPILLVVLIVAVLLKAPLIVFIVLGVLWWKGMFRAGIWRRRW